MSNTVPSITVPSITVPSTGVIVGVDTHKRTYAAVAISALGARLGAITIPVNGKGYRALKTGPLASRAPAPMVPASPGSCASTATRC
jgi:hypothetical protein